MVAVVGVGDEVLRTVEDGFPNVDIHVRGNQITLTGGSADLHLVERLFDEIVSIVRTGQPMTPDAARRALAMLRAEPESSPGDVLTANILSNRGRTIRPKTLNQKRYVDAIDRTPSCSASVPRARARPTWRSPRPSRRCRPRRSTASS